MKNSNTEHGQACKPQRARPEGCSYKTQREVNGQVLNKLCNAVNVPFRSRRNSKDLIRGALGYYPALDFFAINHAGQGGIDPDLIDAAESISWLLCRLVRQEMQTRLRQVFSQLRFQSVQTMAYTMPPVRYGANNALHDLALHYTPLNVKLDCELSMISKNQPADGVEAFISNVLQQWLNG